MEQTIGEAARRTGVTERTLRYYEELGLLTPRRDSGGRRRYDVEHVDRLYRIRLMRALGTPLAEVDPDNSDLLALTAAHLAELDRRLVALSRQRERVRTVEERLMSGATPTDAELVGVLAGLPDTEPSAIRRLALLVYRDIEAAHRYLVEVLGFARGDLTRDEDGMAVHVEDVDGHCERVRDAGGELVHEPTDMPYGVREYAVRDSEGGLWSFMQPLHQEDGAAS